MSGLSSFARVSFLVVTSPYLGSVEAGGGATLTPDRQLNPFDHNVLERVRARAATRLDEGECVKLLTDFKDRRGRTLQSNLEPLGMSASEYLRELSFVDGTSLPGCGRLGVVMATTPGVPRVFVCPAAGHLNSRLARIEFRSGSLAEAMVIHEMLHTLGLGENPPSTFEITARVRDRCR
jgi:hypothetical protein